MGDGAFPRDKHLTAIAVAYKNPESILIAEKVLPRAEVFKKTFGWYEYPRAQAFTLPNMHVSETGQLPRVRMRGERRESTCADRGVVIPVSNRDIDQAPEGVDVREKITEQATNLVNLAYEVDVAKLVFDAAMYSAANKLNLATLGGGTTNQWIAANADSDPLGLILDSFDACLLRPNVFAIGQEAWSKLSRHPKLVKAAGKDSGVGKITREELADLLEVTEVLVGSSFVNSVKPGKEPTMVRTWGKHALGFYRDRTVSPQTGGMTFGLTAVYGTRSAGSKEVEMGVGGGIEVMSGEETKELIIAPDAAFFFQNVVP